MQLCVLENFHVASVLANAIHLLLFRILDQLDTQRKFHIYSEILSRNEGGNSLLPSLHFTELNQSRLGQANDRQKDSQTGIQSRTIFGKPGPVSGKIPQNSAPASAPGTKTEKQPGY